MTSLNAHSKQNLHFYIKLFIMNFTMFVSMGSDIIWENTWNSPPKLRINSQNSGWTVSLHPANKLSQPIRNSDTHNKLIIMSFVKEYTIYFLQGLWLFCIFLHKNSWYSLFMLLAAKLPMILNGTLADCEKGYVLLSTLHRGG